MSYIDGKIASLEEEIQRQEQVVSLVSEVSSAYAKGFQEGKLETLRRELRDLILIKERLGVN